MDLTLHVWRQSGPDAAGSMKTYDAPDISPEMSFLEMLDVVNQRLEESDRSPIVFDHDCREGICGACGLMINGVAHGPEAATTACQLHMRHFKDGDEIIIEPWRAAAFPVIKDLMIDRGALDRVIQAGGYISINAGSAPDANEILVPKTDSDRAFEAASCIGCGACVAQCPNGAAQLFTAAKVSHLSLVPQGQPERYDRVARMVAQMESEAFGSCTNHRECEAVCPKEISIDFIARMNRDFLKARLTGGRG